MHCQKLQIKTLRFFLLRPISVEEEPHAQLILLFFSQFWPINVLIVENYEWYHYKARRA